MASQSSSKNTAPANEMVIKPVAAAVLLIIGGVIVVLVGILFALGSASVSHLSPQNLSRLNLSINATNESELAEVQSLSQVVETAGIIGAIGGLIMIISGTMAYTRAPNGVKMWGVAALIGTLLGIGAFGGLVVGFILGLIGSILALTYKP